MEQPVKFARSARKHKIGKAHALAAMVNAGPPHVVPAHGDYDERLVWIGRDDRNVELQIVAAVKPDALLVIHIQPTSYDHQE